jgi:mannosyltransferase
MHGWTAIFGTSEVALRLPSLIAAAAGVGLAIELGRQLFDPAIGLVTGLILVAIPQLSRYPQDARAYGFAFIFATLATLLLYRAPRRSSWTSWIGYLRARAHAPCNKVSPNLAKQQ